MYAIIATGGKQYRVTEGETIRFERVGGGAGSKVNFEKVLMVGGDGSPRIGRPYLDGVTVEGEVAGEGRAKKILVFKKKRRKGYKKIRGHRQWFTSVRITKINQ